MMGKQVIERGPGRMQGVRTVEAISVGAVREEATT